MCGMRTATGTRQASVYTGLAHNHEGNDRMIRVADLQGSKDTYVVIGINMLRQHTNAGL